jgi:hypothetical protein
VGEGSVFDNRSILVDLDVDSGTLSVDEANNRVGVGTSSPSYSLDVNGTLCISQENSTPATPAAGIGVMYCKSDGKLYYISDDVAETDLTGGGGGGAAADDENTILHMQVFA